MTTHQETNREAELQELFVRAHEQLAERDAEIHRLRGLLAARERELAEATTTLHDVRETLGSFRRSRYWRIRSWTGKALRRLLRRGC
jgi:hypothetical protein